MNKLYKINNVVFSLLLAALLTTSLLASSHREAPLISNDPLADNVDLYAFRSPDNPDMITIIATYVPLQLPHGGPNYYTFGENIRYEIHVDNDASIPGDEIIYRFTFNIQNEDPSTFFYIRAGMQNQKATYTLERSINGGMSFETIVTDGYVAPNNIGPRSINSEVGLNSQYADLFQNAITTSSTGETVFAGPTDDPFFVDLGGIFDLGDAPRQNGDPIDNLACYNVSALAIQVPISTLRKDGAPETPENILDPNYVIGVWASASRPSITTMNTSNDVSFDGDWVQVSRLGMPLTNEAVIAIGDKDYWNSLSPYEEITETTLDEYFYNPELALYMDDDHFGAAVPSFSPLRIQEASLGAFDFTNGADGLYGLKGSDAVAGTALDDAVFGNLLLPAPGKPRSVDLWPAFHTGVPNVVPYQLATGKGGNPLAEGKPFVNNFLPNGGDMLRLNMAVPATPRNDESFSSLGLVNAAVLGLTDPTFANTDIEFIPNMDGFPNGRRLEDDVTRIELQAVSGIVLAAVGLWYDDYDPENSDSPVTDALLGVLTYSTGVEANDREFSSSFPYLAMPNSGTGDCSGEIYEGAPPAPEVVDADFKLLVSSNTQPKIGLIEFDENNTAQVNGIVIDNTDADGIHYDMENDVVYQLDRTNNVINAYSNFYANVESGTEAELTATSTSDFSNGREIAVNGDKLVVAQDASDGNGMVNAFYVYDISPTSITLSNTYISPVNLWGIHLDGNTLYAIQDNSSNLAVFNNFFANADGNIDANRIIEIEGIVRTHGITYEKDNDMMLLTDVGDGGNATDGAFSIVPNFAPAASDDFISSEEQISVGGDLTMLGNPVDIAFDRDGNMIFIAERANAGGRILGFEHTTTGGNVAPAMNELYPGASAVHLTDCVNDGQVDTGSVVYFDLDNCYARTSDLSSADFSEFDAEYPQDLNCAEISASGLFRNMPNMNGHSCIEGVDGDAAMCIGASSDCEFMADSDKAVRFSVTISPNDGSATALTQLSFFEQSPDTYSWIEGPTGDNNYPTLYGVRVTVEGDEIFSMTDINTSQTWMLQEFDFTGIPEFNAESETTYDFELFAYCPVGNGATVSAWDIDEINIVANCGEVMGQLFTIAGQVKTEFGFEVREVKVTNDSKGLPEFPRVADTDVNGQYEFLNNPEGNDFEISGEKDINHLNGVTTLDIVLILKHYFGIKEFDSPYKLIAADVDNNQQVGIGDLFEIRDAILGKNEGKFPNNTSWKMIDASQELSLENPWNHNSVINLQNLSSDVVADFVGVKIGDVNGTARDPGSELNPFSRTDEVLTFEMEEIRMNSGETYMVNVTSDNFREITGFQYAFKWAGVTLENIIPGKLDIKQSNYYTNGSTTNISWNGSKTSSSKEDEVLFTLEFTANENVSTSEAVSEGNSSLQAEAYKGRTLDRIPLNIEFRSGGQDVVASYQLYQNEPNPFADRTLISFNLPESGDATVSIYSVDGKMVQQVKGNFDKGLNSVEVKKSSLTGANVYYYTLESNTFRSTKKMVLFD